MDDELRNRCMKELSETMMNYYKENGGDPLHLLNDLTVSLLSILFLYFDYDKGKPSDFIRIVLDNCISRENDPKIIDAVMEERKRQGFVSGI